MENNEEKESNIPLPEENENETENKKIKLKKNNRIEDYSTFLIKFLKTSEKKLKNNCPKFSSTLYLNNKSNDTKDKFFNSNDSPNIQKVSLSIDQKLTHNKIPNSKQLAMTKSKFNEKKKLIKLEDNNFTTTNNPLKTKRINLNSYINFSSNLLTKPKSYKKQKKIKLIRSVNNINRKRLNALYGYDDFFLKSKKKLLKEKDSTELDNYQNDILKISQRNLRKEHIIKLFSELKYLKNDAEMIKPLPPINYPALIMHSFKEGEDRKNISRVPFDYKKYKDMDDYEKELYGIKKARISCKHTIVEKNKRLYKILEVLPEHVINTIYKRKKRLINII